MKHQFVLHLSAFSKLVMENIPCFLTIILFLLLAVIFKAKISNKNLPPGPWKLPIFGNLHHMVGYDLLHRRLRDLAAIYGPIMHLQLGQIRSIVISSPKLAEEVMKTHDLVFAARPITPENRILSYNGRDIFVSPHGPYLANLKKICSLQLFSAKRIQSFKSVREEELSRIIKFITANEGAPLNLTRMTEALVYCIISRSAFGNAMNLEDAFTPTIRKVVALFDGFRVLNLFPSMMEIVCGLTSRVKKLHEEVDTILEAIIKEHIERKKIQITDTEDLVDVLLSLQDHGSLDIPITTQDIKSVLYDIFLGGVHTTTTTIEWVMSEMVKHPMIMRKAQEEVRRVYNGNTNIDETRLHDLKYLNAVIKETLRLHPPAPLLVPRIAQEDVDILGYNIPKSTQVLVNAWAIGRDPHHWNEPENFWPERFLDSEVNYKGTYFEYIPFGAGRRMCPGMLYAISVVQTVLPTLIYQFNWRPPHGVKNEDLDMSETFGIVTRRKNELCLIPTSYSPNL